MGAELFAVPFAVSLVTFCVLERTTNALLCLLFRTSSWKQSAAHQVMVRQFEFGASVVSVFTVGAARAAVQLLAWWALFLVLFVLLSMASVTYDEYPEVWVGLSNFYNANVGPWIGNMVLAPLRLVDVLVRALIPLWNAIFWWSKIMLVDGLLPACLKNINILLQMATTVVDFCVAIANSLEHFILAFECTGTACLIQENRVMDFMSPMAAVRQFVALGGGLLDAFCSSLAAPVDILLFPLLDLNFAEAVHFLWNAVLQLFLVVPHATAARCGLARGDTFDTLLCTPDFEPVFNYLVAGVSALGVALDNWGNVALVIVEKFLTNMAPECDAALAFEPHAYATSAAMFGANRTAVVGLTEWMYAVTDGYLAFYFGHDSNSMRHAAWPHAMDAGLGVAAVTFTSVVDMVSARAERALFFEG
jgi:hypothetical protein